MSKHKKHAPKPEVPLGTARAQTPPRGEPVGPDGTAPLDARMPAQDAEVLRHTMPGRQGYARDFLAGQMPGLQERLAPDATVSEVGGWIEDDETVARLAQWHREAPHG